MPYGHPLASVVYNAALEMCPMVRELPPVQPLPPHHLDPPMPRYEPPMPRYESPTSWYQLSSVREHDVNLPGSDRFSRPVGVAPVGVFEPAWKNRGW